MHRMLRCVRKPCLHAAPHRKLSILQISTNIKNKISSLAYDIKKDFLGIILDGFQRGGPPDHVKIFVF